MNASAPAHPGDRLSLYCTGLGEAQSFESVTVTIKHSWAKVLFAGLDADNPGLYRLEVVVLETAAGTGIQPLMVTAGGCRSKPLILPIE